MYYHQPTNTVGPLPKSAKINGRRLTNFPLAPPVTHVAAGYYAVRSDTPERPSDTIEDVGARVVTIDGTECDIVRTWVDAPGPTPEEKEIARQNGKSADHKQADNIYHAVKAKHGIPDDMDPSDIIQLIAAANNPKDQAEGLASAVNLLRVAVSEMTGIDPLKDAIEHE